MFTMRYCIALLIKFCLILSVTGKFPFLFFFLSSVFICSLCCFLQEQYVVILRAVGDGRFRKEGRSAGFPAGGGEENHIAKAAGGFAYVVIRHPPCSPLYYVFMALFTLGLNLGGQMSGHLPPLDLALPLRGD